MLFEFTKPLFIRDSKPISGLIIEYAESGVVEGPTSITIQQVVTDYTETSMTLKPSGSKIIIPSVDLDEFIKILTA